MDTKRARPIAVLCVVLAIIGTAQLMAGGLIRAIDPRGDSFGFEPVWVRLLTGTWFGMALLLVAAVLGIIAIVRTRERADDPGLLRWSRAIRVLIFLLSAAGLGFVLALGWDELKGHIFWDAAPWAPGGIGVLVGMVVTICLLSWIVQRIEEKRRRYPENIDAVPEPFRSYAKDRGPVWSGVRDALHGGILGAVIAIGWAFRPGATGQLGIVIVGIIAIVVFGFLALAAWDVDTKERGAGDAVRERIARVRGHGTRVRAEVVAVDDFEWMPAYASIDTVRFELTARYEGGRDAQIHRGEIFADVTDAPVAGGTVLVWYLGDTVEDRYMEPDPDSIRDPEARAKYRRPEP